MNSIEKKKTKYANANIDVYDHGVTDGKPLDLFKETKTMSNLSFQTYTA